MRNALAFLLACLPLAAQTRDEALSGDWWDDRNGERLTLMKDGAAELRGHEYYDLVKGTWQGTKSDGAKVEWTEVIRPEWDSRPREVADWKLAFADGRLTIREERLSRSFRQATVAEREKELADALHELIPARLGMKEEKDPRKRVEIRKRVEGLKSKLAFGSLLRQRVDGKPEDADAMVLRILKAHRPEDVPAFEKANLRDKDVDCLNRLKQLGVYLALYESKFKKYPARLEDVKRPDMATDEDLFRCPVLGEGHLYKYVFPEKGDETASGALILYCDGPHPDGQRRFGDFCGRAYSLPEAEYQEALKAGSFEKLFPVIDGAVIRRAPDGNDVAVTVSFRARHLRPIQHEGKSKFFVSASMSCWGGGEDDLETELQLFEQPAIGDGMEMELVLKIPKTAIDNGASLHVRITDESTGRDATWYQALRR